ERGDEDWNRNGRVAVDVSCVRAAREFAEDERFIADGSGGLRAPARMRRVGRDRDRILVSARGNLVDAGRDFRLLYVTLARARAEIDDAGDARACGNLRHV